MSRPKEYTPEQESWLQKYFDSYETYADLTDAFNKQFNQNRTPYSIQAKLYSLQLRKRDRHEYTDEQSQWLKIHAANLTVQDVANTFNKTFNTSISPRSIYNHMCTFGINYNKERNTITQEMIEWLRINRSHYAITELTNKFNKQFNTNSSKNAIQTILHRNHILKTPPKSSNHSSANITKTVPTRDHPEPHFILFQSSSEDVNQWISVQENPEVSIKLLIKNYVATHGITDVFDQSFQFAGQIKTVNEPPVIKPTSTGSRKSAALDFCTKCIKDVKWIDDAPVTRQTNSHMKQVGEALAEIYMGYNNNMYPGIPESDIILVINNKLKSSTYEAIMDIGEVAASKSELSPIAAVMNQWIRQAFKKQLKKSA